MRRQHRILAALSAARRGLTLRELAGAVDAGCSLRTLYRDLEQLALAGYALVREEGRHRLAATSRLPEPTSAASLAALRVVVEALLPTTGAWLGEPLGELLRQVEAGVTPAARAWSRELGARRLLRVGAPLPRERAAALPLLVQAVDDEQRVAARPRPGAARPAAARAEADPDVVLEPHALALIAGELWVLAAHAAAPAAALAWLPLAALGEVRLLEETFERRAGPTLADLAPGLPPGPGGVTG